MKEQNSEEIDASNSSFGSSFFGSQLRTDGSWESDKTCTECTKDTKKRGKIPYWMKNVESTPELVLRYQVQTKELGDALQADMRVLREISQVNC